MLSHVWDMSSVTPKRSTAIFVDWSAAKAHSVATQNLFGGEGGSPGRWRLRPFASGERLIGREANIQEIVKTNAEIGTPRTVQAGDAILQ